MGTTGGRRMGGIALLFASALVAGYLIFLCDFKWLVVLSTLLTGWISIDIHFFDGWIMAKLGYRRKAQEDPASVQKKLSDAPIPVPPHSLRKLVHRELLLARLCVTLVPVLCFPLVGYLVYFAIEHLDVSNIQSTDILLLAPMVVFTAFGTAGLLQGRKTLKKLNPLLERGVLINALVLKTIYISRHRGGSLAYELTYEYKFAEKKYQATNSRNRLVHNSSSSVMPIIVDPQNPEQHTFVDDDAYKELMPPTIKPGKPYPDILASVELS